MAAPTEPILLTPGPLTTSPETKAAMLRDWDSRDGDFIALNARVRAAIVDIAGGNEIGLQLAEVEALEPSVRAAKRERAYRRMHQASAHYAVDDISRMMPCIDDIETRIASDERP